MSNRRIARSTVYYLHADRKETCQSRLRSIAIHFLPWQAAPARQRAKWYTTRVVPCLAADRHLYTVSRPMTAPTIRIHLLLAHAASRILIIRRGPTRIYHLVL